MSRFDCSAQTLQQVCLLSSIKLYASYLLSTPRFKHIQYKELYKETVWNQKQQNVNGLSLSLFLRTALTAPIAYQLCTFDLETSWKCNRITPTWIASRCTPFNSKLARSSITSDVTPKAKGQFLYYKQQRKPVTNAETEWNRHLNGDLDLAFLLS